MADWNAEASVPSIKYLEVMHLPWPIWPEDLCFSAGVSMYYIQYILQYILHSTYSPIQQLRPKPSNRWSFKSRAKLAWMDLSRTTLCTTHGHTMGPRSLKSHLNFLSGTIWQFFFGQLFFTTVLGISLVRRIHFTKLKYFVVNSFYMKCKVKVICLVKCRWKWWIFSIL